MRYIYYFEQVYKGLIKSPILKCPRRVILHYCPDVSGNGKVKPYLEIINGENFKLIWTNKKSCHLSSYKISKREVFQNIKIDIDTDECLSGDLYFRIKHKG